MKFAVAILVLLPLALGAILDEEGFLMSFWRVHAIDIGKSILCKFGTDETEAHCEATLCPETLNKINITGLAQSLVCDDVCKEALVLIKQYGTTGDLNCGTAPAQ